MRRAESNQHVTGQAVHFLFVILCTMSIISLTIAGFLMDKEVGYILQINLLSLVLISIVIVYIHSFMTHMVWMKKAYFLFGLAYCYTLICSLCGMKMELYDLWMLGPLVICIFLDVNLGIFLHVFFVFYRIFFFQGSLIPIFYQLILGLVVLMTAKYFTTKMMFLYSVIIDLTCCASLALIEKQFQYTEAMNQSLYLELASLFIVLVIAFLLKWKLEGMEWKHDVVLMKQTEESAASMEDNSPVNSDLEQRNELDQQLDLLLSPDFELLKRLKQNETLYEHSKNIAVLCEEAAKVIQANEKLAKTGGIYHEIGRLISKNYIEEGLKLADQYQFPREVKNIIIEHNAKSGHPTSKEATIVMLSDSLVSSIEYIRKVSEGQKITLQKLVDNLFDSRLSKGILDESGLNLMQYKQLKEFYMTHLNID